jgi:hypothetical protein
VFLDVDQGRCALCKAIISITLGLCVGCARSRLVRRVWGERKRRGSSSRRQRRQRRGAEVSQARCKFARKFSQRHARRPVTDARESQNYGSLRISSDGRSAALVLSRSSVRCPRERWSPARPSLVVAPDNESKHAPAQPTKQRHSSWRYRARLAPIDIAYHIPLSILRRHSPRIPQRPDRLSLLCFSSGRPRRVPHRLLDSSTPRLLDSSTPRRAR